MQERFGGGAYCLGPERRQYLPECPGFYVRIADDLRKTVVFFGFEDITPGKGGINCVGTGFLVQYDGLGHLVTAKHLAKQLGNDPFLIRINKHDGTSENLHADGAKWAEHPDPLVDVAAIPFNISQSRGHQAIYLPSSMMLTNEALATDPIHVGDLTYTIGLFRYMSGERRNLPVVHFGSIALMPSDEKIPIRDWRDPDGKRIIKVEGYLVETQAMPGLSGSPVFARATVSMSRIPPQVLVDPRFPMTEAMFALSPRADVRLLGMWQSSWDAPPDEVMAIQAGKAVRVPVGMGIVVSAQRIEETLLQLKDFQDMVKTKRAEEAATPDSAISLVRSVPGDNDAALPSDDANPHHREDFNRLLNAAARRREPED
jgi:hypothetical protein